MAFRVIQWGAGNTGVHALRQIWQHPELELAGVWVHSAAKAGLDAAEICGLETPTGIIASTDKAAVAAIDADCVCYMPRNVSHAHPLNPGSEGGPLLDEVCDFLAGGKDVVSVSLVQLIWPAFWGDEVRARLEAACREGGSTFTGVGLAPGFVTDGLLLSLSSMSERITQMRCSQILNYASYDLLARLRALGFGVSEDESRGLWTPGALADTYGCVVSMIADVMGLELHTLEESVDLCTTDDEFEIAAGVIPAGTVAAFRSELAGIVDGRKAIVVENVARLRDDLAPEWPSLPDGRQGYALRIDGSPQLDVAVGLAHDGATAFVEACRATAAVAVNAIPQVCRFGPGVITYMDRTPVVGPGFSLV
jgi:hypothetical protein